MITDIQVDGYRLLDRFHADLGDLTVVIGANATGKSTVLDFLQMVCDCANAPIKTAFDWHGGFFAIRNAASESERIQWSITLEKPSSPMWWNIVPLEEGQKYKYEVTIKGEPSGRVIPLHEVLLRAEPFPGHDRPLKFLESTQNKSHLFDPKVRKLIPFDQALPQSKPDAGAPEQSAPIPPPPPQAQEPTLRLAQMRFFNEFPYPSWIRTMLSNFALYTTFDVSKLSKIRTNPPEITSETTLWSSGENLGTVLHELFTRYDYRPVAERFREFLKVAYPFVEDIFPETGYGTPARILVRVREKGMRRSMETWDLSDGMLRFLCLTASLLNPYPPSLILIDEPEVGLHPRLLPVIADLIKTASERTQVFITTHSPELLNSFSIEEIAVLTRDENRAGWHRPADRKSLVTLLESAMGPTLGDMHKSGELEAIE